MRYFNLKKAVMTAFLILVIVPVLTAMGKNDESEAVPVNGLENWEHSVDVSDLEPGEYNIIVRAKDYAGNTGIGGPFNIIVDPSLMIPSVSISNPISGGRVGRLLHAVGTASDDEGVSRVEVAIDDGNFQPAEGREFWSASFDCSSWDDGVHILKTRAVDAEGNESPVEEVSFYKDTGKPLIELSSHSSGSFISGKTVLQGMVSDLNGVSELKVLSDVSEDYIDLKLTASKTEGVWDFKYLINTLDINDGTHVYRFKAKDDLGIESVQSFLFYIDNSTPRLDLIHPSEEGIVNGKFTLIGTASDAVGLKTLFYKADNGAEGEIVLHAGNPVWVLPVDYSNINVKAAKIEMTLTDIVGNTVSEVFKIPLDIESDLPDPGVAESIHGTVFESVPVIRGLLADDDGTEGVLEYSLNGGEKQDIEVAGAWQLEFEEAVFGLNKLVMKAYDTNRVAGEPVVIEFFRNYPAPEVVFDSYIDGESETPWFPGKVFNAKNPGSIKGRIINPGSVTGLSWLINSEEIGSMSIKSGSTADDYGFTIKLPKNLPSGKIELEAVVSNSEGILRLKKSTYYNYLQPEPAEDGTVAEFEYPERQNLYMIFPEDSVDSDFIRLNPDNEISGYTAGGEISQVEFDEEAGFLSVKIESDAFIIKAARDGRIDDAVLKVRLKNGAEFSTAPLTIISDNSAPAVTVSSPLSNDIIGRDFKISIGMNEEASAAYSLDGGLSFKQMSDDGIISTSGLSDGLIDLVVKATDYAGNSALKFFPLTKDTAAPEADMITSAFEQGASQITYSGLIDEFSGVSNVLIRFMPPEQANEPSNEPPVQPVEFEAEVHGGAFYSNINLIDLGFEPSVVEFELSDSASNIKKIIQKVDLDIYSGKPVVEIQVPAEKAAFETDFAMSGMVFDKEGLTSVQYSLNDGPFIDAGPDSLYNVPFQLPQLLDDVNVLRVRAVDVNGLESDVAERSFVISLKEPEMNLEYPPLDSIVNGRILVKGKAEDKNGIEAVFISQDNGNTLQKAEGQEEWTYSLDTELLDDGVSPLLFRVVDKAGVEAFYTTLINVDNTVPAINITRPRDGEDVRGSLVLNGRISDNSLNGDARVIIAPLNSEAEESVFTVPTTGVLNEKIEVADLPPGQYSFRIEASDSAENTGSVSRVINIQPDVLQPPVLLSPLPGEALGPVFSIQGHCSEDVSKVQILLNNNIFDTADVGANGFFRKDVSAEDFSAAGALTISLRVEGAGEQAQSDPVNVIYTEEGLWVSIDNLSENQFVTDRFRIEGRTGFIMETEDEKELQKMQPDTVMISLDGGKTFERCSLKKGIWSFVLFSEEVPDGDIDVLVRAVNGTDIAFARCRAVMDSKVPQVSLLNPGENQHIFGELVISGEAFDDNGLGEVALNLREGDKDSYETPSFIQGMYFDATGLGATYFTTGLGLTFMDDNVKLQMQYGYAPTTVIDPETNRERSARFGGNVFGAKLLANIAQVPFSWLLGPEWSFMSASAALGANFSYFSSNSSNSMESWGVILAGVVGQLEVPKITFEDRSFIKYISVFWEGQLWLISSDVSPEVVLLPSIGVRVGLF